MSRASDEAARRPRFTDDGWVVEIAGDDPSVEDWAATLCALANGTLGVRGTIEERAHATTFLAHAYEQSPIRYHERLPGFADKSDTRVPVVETLAMTIALDGEPVSLDGAEPRTVRRLDLRRGLLERRTTWHLRDGRRLTVEADRIVPLKGGGLLLRRLTASSPDGPVTLSPVLATAPPPARQSADPRLGVDLAGGFVREAGAGDALVERLPGSGIAVAAVQRVAAADGGLVVATGLATGRGAAVELAATAAATAERGLVPRFAAAVTAQAATLADFWAAADVEVEGDPRLGPALRLNLFHLFTSTGRDGASSAAAKGLTGEGYEGHYFWDAEVFVLPVLAVLAPEVARSMLLYRAATLAAARANARALNHERGALYAWRTIAGRECSAHYPSGSAQYHINAAIAFAIGAYVEATGDEDFLVEHGARMLIETARLWLALGDWQDGAFHLRGVTGPDEYTALVDDNWYTNRMAQRHLRQAVAAAETVAMRAPATWAALTDELALADAEIAAFAAAADAMALPYDAVRDLDAQDASFLDKPRWDLAATPADRFPLLLHYHPMTLYRHQVAKQADLVLGLVLAGDDVPVDRKRRAYEHYKQVTTHDSTLSAATFAVLAAEVGADADALRFLAEAAYVDVEDRHGNTGHGMHMAALAGSWQALVWGFGGFRPGRARLGFRPRCPAAWTGYRFGLQWRGTRLRVAVTRERATYTVTDGPAITFDHHATAVTIAAGESWTGPVG